MSRWIDLCANRAITTDVAKTLKLPDAREWFDRGDEFNYTQHELHKRGRQTGEQGLFIHPIITLKAFASECYLKSLITLEGSSPPEIHHLLRLFDRLRPASKDKIEKLWNRHSKPELDKWKRQFPKDKLPNNLRAALDESAEAFVHWRYVHTSSRLQYSAMAFPQYVRWRIVELTNWGYDPPHPLAPFNPESELIKGKTDGLGGLPPGAAILNPKSPAFTSALAYIDRTNPKDRGPK